MKKSLGVFFLCLIGLTALIAVNRWDLPIAVWLGWLCGLGMLFSGIFVLTIGAA